MSITRLKLEIDTDGRMLFREMLSHGMKMQVGVIPGADKGKPEIPEFAKLPNFDEPPVVPVPKVASDLTVGLLVSLGARTRDDEPFERANDLSIRTIDRAIPSSEIVFDHKTPARLWADTDLNVAFPRDRMAELEAEGIIGTLAPKAVSILGSISLWEEIATDLAPRIVDEFKTQGVDIVLVVPFCPQCHQATSLLARAIEGRGMPTLMLSTFLDISEAFKPPRVAVVDYPVGSPCGRTEDPEHQRATLRDVFATNLSAGSRQLNLIDRPYQVDKGRDWIRKTIDLYFEGIGETNTNYLHHRTSSSLAGREEEFTIQCNC